MDNLNDPRKGAFTDTSPIRSDRLFIQNNYWNFRTREGMDIGPFDSINEAVYGVDNFIEFVDAAKPEIIERIARYFRSTT